MRYEYRMVRLSLLVPALSVESDLDPTPSGRVLVDGLRENGWRWVDTVTLGPPDPAVYARFERVVEGSRTLEG